MMRVVAPALRLALYTAQPAPSLPRTTFLGLSDPPDLARGRVRPVACAVDASRLVDSTDGWRLKLAPLPPPERAGVRLDSWHPDTSSPAVRITRLAMQSQH